MHAVVIRFINAVVKHFKITFAYATAAQWTKFAFAVIGAVYFFLISFFAFDGFTERQYGFVAPGCRPIVCRRSSIFLPSQIKGYVNSIPPTMTVRFIISDNG